MQFDMQLLERLNDFSWSLLEKARLDGVFEKYRIPPISFPIAIIVLIIALFLVFSPHGAAPAVNDQCGNGSCEPALNEDLISCPEDCAPKAASLKKVKVELLGDVLSTVEVTLEDSMRDLIQTKSGKSTQFSFSDISASEVIATVRNPANSRVASSEFAALDAGTTTIPVTIPADFFSTASAVPAKGTLRVVLRDKETAESVYGKVTVLLQSGSSYMVSGSSDVSGAGYFTIEADKWHSVNVEASGYKPYDGRENLIHVTPGEQREVVVLLEPDENAGPALLTVCVSDQGGSTVPGSVRVSSFSGEELSTQQLSFGCASFELNSASLVMAATYGLPSNCTDADGDADLSAGVGKINLSVTCGELGYVRAVVVSENNTPLTQNASITAWYSNGSQIRGTGLSGAMVPASGGYTEYVRVAPLTPFYFLVSGVHGYSTYTSGNYTVPPSENKSVTITLHPPAQATRSFSFQYSFPEPVAIGSNFTVIVSKVLYGQTDVSNSANLTVGLAGTGCAVIKSRYWYATCTAPQRPGEYDLSLYATYSGFSGSKVDNVTVAITATGGFELTPHAILDALPPIRIDFDIKFNGTPLDSLTDSSVAVYYGDGQVWVDDSPEITGGSGNYSMSVDTPFPGNHSARITLIKALDKIYEQNFTLSFVSSPTSVLVSRNQSIIPQILEPGEPYAVYTTLRYKSKEIANLTNVYATVNGIRSSLSWSQSLHAYEGYLSAPSIEGIYKVLLELAYQKLSEPKIYAIDTTKDQSLECDISNCETRPDARKCAYRHRYETPPMYSEPDTIECIEDAWNLGTGVSILHCLDPSANRGDWNNNCKLDASDDDIMRTVFTKIPSQQERNEYRYCGDMNNDNDADTEDLSCLSNVISGNWTGDKGNGSCASQLKGGFCYGFDMTSYLKGDFNDDGQITQADVDILSLILTDIGKGVTPTGEMMDFTDFDQDGDIDLSDKSCMEQYRDIDIRQMVNNIKQGIQNLPNFEPRCLNIYRIGCSGTPGDLNNDSTINDVDLMILGLIVSDVGGAFTDASGQAFNWTGAFNIGKGQEISLPVMIPFYGDWMIEMTGNFDFSNEEGPLFRDPTFSAEEGRGRLSAVVYNKGNLPGQENMSPAIIFSLATDEFGAFLPVTKAYKGAVAWNQGGHTTKTQPAGNNKLRISYYYPEKRYRIHWDDKLVGHFEVEESQKRQGAFNWTVPQLFFQESSGAFKYYVGDLDPYMTRFGSLKCADFNEDGLIDEYDLLCLSMFTSQTSDYLDSEFCQSCTQKGVKEGWYATEDYCADGIDNNCDGVVDFVRLGSRVDANDCDCASSFCDRGAKYDLDRGASFGIADGNYAICVSMSWEDEDPWGATHPPGERHWTDQRKFMAECTSEMQCHFYNCYDNFEICTEGSWRQFGGGSFIGANAANYDEMMNNPEYAAQVESYRTRSYEYAPGKSTSTGESSGAPAAKQNEDGSSSINPSGIEDGYALSMDGLNYVGSVCHSGNGTTTYYGPWGTFLPCEGSCKKEYADYCGSGDGIDNNCWGGDAPIKKDDNDCGFLSINCWFD